MIPTCTISFSQEVAPSKTKSAFWASDIKKARAIQKGDIEVDLDVLKAGLQDALERERNAPKEDHNEAFTRQPQVRNDSGNFNMSANPAEEDMIFPIEELEFVGSTRMIDDLLHVEKKEESVRGFPGWSKLRLK